MNDEKHPSQAATTPAASQAELNAAQRLGRIGSWVWYAEADTTFWSQELHCLFGHDPAEPPPRFAQHPPLFAPESWRRLEAAVATALSHGQPYCLELAYVRVDGAGGGWLEARGEAIRDAAGAIAGLRGTAQEISDRRRHHAAETEVRTRRDRAALLRAFSQSIRTSLNGVSGFARLLHSKVDAGSSQARWIAQILAGSQQIVTLLEEMEGLDGGFFGQAGAEPAGGAESNAARLQKLLEMIPCPVLIHNHAGEILHVSRALMECTGYSREELPTRSAWAVLAYRDGDQDAHEVAACVAETRASRSVGDGGERWVTTKSGEKRRWQLFAAPTVAHHGGEPLVMSIGIDVTARHAATASA